jgi:DNA-binding NtrC family response regulator
VIVGDKLDRTTGQKAIIDLPPGGAWYVILALGDDGQTRVIPLDDGAELVFGRSAEAAVVVEHEAVSRRHTAIRRRGESVMVEDLRSRNGTTLNGAPLTGVRRAVIGDVIGIGPIAAIVARSNTAAPAAQVPARPSLGRLAEALPQIVVADPAMKQVFERAERAAAAPISVLIVGETGTGKEVVAEAIHRLSPRAQAPFVRLSCAALTETLVESELFGHERHAFTGATAMKRGFFEAGHGGTVFLDEIGELPLATQVKLLRVLERWQIVRVGGTTEIPVDVRLVCATHRDLEAEVQLGRFREDLFFRIAAFVIPVPPLRDRRAEIIPLALHFARELGHPGVGFTEPALAALEQAIWPGNVRELRNAIARALVLSEGGAIGREHLPEPIEQVRTTASGALDVRQRVADVERETVAAALGAADGNQTLAAKKLGVSRFALIRLMAKHDLKRR